MILDTYFDIIAIVSVMAGILSSIIIFLDLWKNPQKMPVMNPVWVINALWGSVFILWFYFKYAKNNNQTTHHNQNMGNMMDMDMNMNNMSVSDININKSSYQESHSPNFCQKIITSTMHCGAGCTLADFIGAIVFLVIPLTLFNSKIVAEWTFDYILALIIGVSFQYYAISPMLKQKGLNIWLKALKIDFLSLSSWQIGMYGFHIIVILTISSNTLRNINSFHYWFLMQISMFCGFLTSYPVNWWLVKKKIKIIME